MAPVWEGSWWALWRAFILQFAVLMWLLTYVGALFNGLTLLLMGKGSWVPWTARVWCFHSCQLPASWWIARNKHQTPPKSRVSCRPFNNGLFNVLFFLQSHHEICLWDIYICGGSYGWINCYLERAQGTLIIYRYNIIFDFLMPCHLWSTMPIFPQVMLQSHDYAECICKLALLIFLKALMVWWF